MSMDELLFYGGLAVAAGSAVLGIITAVALKIRHIRIETQMNEEYGKKEILKQQSAT